jgi:FtsZ-binding cell division protein ZapB
MAEIKTELELTGLEHFLQLEDKIIRIVEAMKSLRKENETLRSENQKLRSEAETLRRYRENYEESLSTLQKEREQLRDRVERALALLANLETDPSTPPG